MNLLFLIKSTRQSANDTKSAFETVLRQKKKVVTSKTIRSLELQVKPFQFKLYSNKSLLFIEDGRKKGKKMPVYKEGDEFKLFPELEEWKIKVNFLGTDFQLAAGIKKNGIKPTPIFDTVEQIIEPKIKRNITDAFTKDIQINSVLSAKSVFENL